MATPSATRIEDHALVGNTRSAALVRSDGTADWLCLPDFDSAANFASLLGSTEHGFWRIAPAHQDGAVPRTADRRGYRGNSLVLDQEWDTPTGSVRVTDLMPLGEVDDSDPPAQLIRIVEGLSGTVAMRSQINLRFDYGNLAPPLRRTGRREGVQRLAAVAGPDALCLDGLRHTGSRRGVNRADFAVRAGETIAFALTWQPERLGPPAVPDAQAALAATEWCWATWADRCTYQGPDREAVLRSLITLKALTHTPTGGIVAAPTTSLPEWIGGPRNWDYRYVWLRDSALTISALVRCGYIEEARAWRAWLLRAVADKPGRMPVIYGLRGERDLTERVLDLPGYENSTPVRIGNAAAGQLQLDVYGEVADALLLAEHAGLEPDEETDGLLLHLADILATSWRSPDEGIWEIRGKRRHFVHSKVMAWVAVDRVITMLERRPTVAGEVLERLCGLRAEIHEDVCTYGYDPDRNTFTQHYGSEDLDAALLLIPAVGFLPADDKRVIGTVEAVQRELSTPDGFLLRYPTHEEEHANVDGLAGHEGAFLACSFWLADALALIGRTTEARQLFDRLLALRNDVGLLAEEWDPVAQRQLGNFPQGFSHWALVNTASHLAVGPPYAAIAPTSQPSRRDALTLTS